MNLFTFIGNTLASADKVISNSTDVLVNTSKAAANYSAVAEAHSEHTLNTYKLENVAEIAKTRKELEQLTVTLD